MIVRRALLLLFVLVLGACDDDAAGPETDPAVGLYVLQTINDQPMPYPLINVLNALILEQVGGTMRLNEDQTSMQRDSLRWTITNDQGVPEMSDTTVVYTGTWKRSGNVMEVTDQFNQLQFGALSGSRLTLNLVLKGTVFTYVYLKQNP